MELYPTTAEKPKLQGAVLILPIVSTGNVAQLATDLLISTFEFKRVAILDSRYLIPSVGAREDGEEGITTPIELYGKEGTDMFLVQQRSPVIKAQKTEFITSFLEFITGSRFSAVLILSGVDLSNRPDAHMQATTYHLIPSSPAHANLPPVLQSVVTNVPPFITDKQQQHLATPAVLPGSGLTRRIITSLPTSFPSTGVLLEYVLEGDNRADALILARATAGCLQKELGVTGKEMWREPSSWKEGLFGSGPDQILFG